VLSDFKRARNNINRPQTDRFSRHAKNNARLLILSERYMTLFMELLHPESAIRTHSG